MDTNSFCHTRLLAAAVIAALAGCASAPQEAAFDAPVFTPVVAESPAVAEPAVLPPPALKPDHPQRYVVVRGDTLWDISSRFLEDPWRWPELWEANPQIANPHLIYPGDVLALEYVDGRPLIRLQRAAGGRKEIRLSPQVRIEELDRAIPTIPIDAIRQFLSRPSVVGAGELDTSPYIVATAEQRFAAAAGDRVYVRGLEDERQADYVVVRAGEAYRNPEDPGDILGYEAIHVADAQVTTFGDPATVLLKRSKMEVLKGDRLVPADDTVPDTSFLPRGPEQEVKGHIIAVPGGVAQIGQYQVVAISLGKQDRMAPGHVLAIHQAGAMVRDTVRGEEIQLPDERAGVLMVFRVFDRVSYALVLRATRALHVLDVVTNP